MNPKYPVYIISKGRYESRHTSKSLERMNVPYRIVVEPQEYDLYAQYIDESKILVTPFSNLGLGSIPSRNFVWDHAVSEGHERHWILDDNINGFIRFNRNMKIPVADGTIFKCAEDFVDRYENIALAGFNYRFLGGTQRQVSAPFILNTRIYSCILIKNDIDYRWRGRYNEDTDLSLRALKDGYCTVLFQAFLCNKLATMTVKGGNTEELYKDDGRLKMAQSLVDQHPDVTTISYKWGRPQHQVDYSPFKDNRLKLKDNVQINRGINEYGMTLRRTTT